MKRRIGFALSLFALLGLFFLSVPDGAGGQGFAGDDYRFGKGR